MYNPFKALYKWFIGLREGFYGTIDSTDRWRRTGSFKKRKKRGNG
jgi:hypothetical protein